MKKCTVINYLSAVTNVT